MFSKKSEFELIGGKAISGKRCRYYAVMLKNGENLFYQFLEQNQQKAGEEVKDLLMRLKEMASTFGAREDYFKMNYGKPGDGVCALPSKKLRLICLRFSTVAVVLGGGALKNTRAVQNEELLEPFRQFMVYLSAQIMQRIRTREIRLEGNQLIGNLKFYNEEQ